MTPLHGIACFYDVGFGARAVSRKTPIYFMIMMMTAMITTTMTFTSLSAFPVSLSSLLLPLFLGHDDIDDHDFGLIMFINGYH